MRMKILFWISVAIPLYAYVGYPVALLLLRLVHHRPVRKGPAEPFVSLLVPAHNERDMIERKIRNALALHYPSDKLEIVIACDGSTDATPDIAKQLADGQRVRVLAFPLNRGKVATFNEAIRSLRGDVIVFSDATALLHPDSVARLVANFADATVGAVSGKYTVIEADEDGAGRSEDVYWRYETLLKMLESELSSTLGAHGHLHAIRRELYPFPDPATINDDYVIPVSVVGRGFRAVYEPTAIVSEEAREMSGFSRRVRIMAGNIQQLREIGSLCSPPRLMPLFFFLSHKAVRLLVPFAMLGALLANLFLWDSSPFYGALIVLQAAFYLLALAGLAVTLRPRLLMLPCYFTTINAAVFVGLYHALTGRRSLAWK